MQFFPSRWVMRIVVMVLWGTLLGVTFKADGWALLLPPRMPLGFPSGACVGIEWHSLLNQVVAAISRSDASEPPGIIYDPDECAWYIQLSEMDDPPAGWQGLLILKARSRTDGQPYHPGAAGSTMARFDVDHHSLWWLFRGQTPWSKATQPQDWEGWLRQAPAGQRLVFRCFGSASREEDPILVQTWWPTTTSLSLPLQPLP